MGITYTEFINLVVGLMQATGLMPVVITALAGFLAIAMFKFLVGKD